MYDIVKNKNIVTVVRRKKNGDTTTIATVISTVDGKVAIVPVARLASYKFIGATFKQAKNDAIALVDDKLEIYIKPHYMALHTAIIAKNRGVLHHNAYAENNKALDIPPVSNDFDKLLDDMHECIAVV